MNANERVLRAVQQGNWATARVKQWFGVCPQTTPQRKQRIRLTVAFGLLSDLQRASYDPSKVKTHTSTTQRELPRTCIPLSLIHPPAITPPTTPYALRMHTDNRLALGKIVFCFEKSSPRTKQKH